MKIFEKNNKIEKKLAHGIKRKYLHYKICLLISLLILIYMIFRKDNWEIVSWIIEGNEDRSMTVLLLIGYNLIPLLGIMLLMLTSISGGRDILLARLNEQMILENEHLKIVYTPKYRNIENGDHVEITIPYEKVNEMKYDKKFKRLEIKADYTYKIWYNINLGYGADNVKESHFEDRVVNIYDCFNEMEDFKTSLEDLTGKVITIKEKSQKGSKGAKTKNLI